MVECAKCGKKISFFKSESDWSGNRFCNEECKAKFKGHKIKTPKRESTSEETKKEITPEEKKEGILALVFLVIDGIITYFFYKYFINDLFASLFSLSKWEKVIYTVIFFLLAFGSMWYAHNQSTFFETNKYGIKVKEDDATSKIGKLKELKDKGAISKEEFEKKKKELLENF